MSQQKYNQRVRFTTEPELPAYLEEIINHAGCEGSVSISVCRCACSCRSAMSQIVLFNGRYDNLYLPGCLPR